MSGATMSRVRAAFAIATLLAGAAACLPEPDVGAPLAGGCAPEDSDPDEDVSFGRDLRPLFDRGRGEGGCGCHNAGGIGVQLSGFDMSSLPALLRDGEAVVPGDPCASRLVEKLSSAPSNGARMPLDGPPFLSDSELQLVRDWIAEGADDD